MYCEIGLDQRAKFRRDLGRWPNHNSNPRTAWCSSMPSPSAVFSPRARAAASNGVSSGT